MDNMKVYLAPLGRLLMSSLFIWAGYHKLMNPSGTAQVFAERYHIPLPDVAVWIAVVIELIGGLMILVGSRPDGLHWCLRSSASVRVSARTCQSETCQT
jgi:uncharacterized membrane protein YphA (DoxX/SURF4 family)